MGGVDNNRGSSWWVKGFSYVLAREWFVIPRYCVFSFFGFRSLGGFFLLWRLICMNIAWHLHIFPPNPSSTFVPQRLRYLWFEPGKY